MVEFLGILTSARRMPESARNRETRYCLTKLAATVSQSTLSTAVDRNRCGRQPIQRTPKEQRGVTNDIYSRLAISKDVKAAADYDVILQLCGADGRDT